MLPSRKYYLDSIFDDFMDSSDTFDVMKCDVYEKDGFYHIEADIPGFNKDEINIESENGYITISTEKKYDNDIDNSDRSYIRRERFYGRTVRKFYIGEVDEEKINAKFENGILELVIPKEEKLPNKKTIEIK